ncbi:hypothetical protein FA13DRAFT_1451475 [Coprinellus micaceus]|uniref:Uncharacterized protein n=1 Tax=Coprinellus micaceus TaxID=71717 RepID=A0A4Y7SNG4_COPMI|nr:hypothetical protein FA13DRAFT_1451475 [Coprinellus micaceus]
MVLVQPKYETQALPLSGSERSVVVTPESSGRYLRTPLVLAGAPPAVGLGPPAEGPVPTEPEEGAVLGTLAGLAPYHTNVSMPTPPFRTKRERPYRSGLRAGSGGLLWGHSNGLEGAKD